MAVYPSRTPRASSNPALARGLRDVADWLDEHPELPDVVYVPVLFRTRYAIGGCARSDLRVLACALGDRALEVRDQDVVRIEADFAGERLLVVQAEATVAQLRGEPEPVADYEPIMAPRRVGLAVAS